jgi:hypothetical protein
MASRLMNPMSAIPHRRPVALTIRRGRLALVNSADETRTPQRILIIKQRHGLCCVGAEEAGGSHRTPPLVRESDGEGKVGEGDREPMARIEVDGEFIVSAAEVLDEGVSGTDQSG